MSFLICQVSSWSLKSHRVSRHRRVSILVPDRQTGIAVLFPSIQSEKTHSGPLTPQEELETQPLFTVPRLTVLERTYSPAPVGPWCRRESTDPGIRSPSTKSNMNQLQNLRPVLLQLEVSRNGLGCFLNVDSWAHFRSISSQQPGIAPQHPNFNQHS